MDLRKNGLGVISVYLLPVCLYWYTLNLIDAFHWFINECVHFYTCVPTEKLKFKKSKLWGLMKNLNIMEILNQLLLAHKIFF